MQFEYSTLLLAVAKRHISNICSVSLHASMTLPIHIFATWLNSKTKKSRPVIGRDIIHVNHLLLHTNICVPINGGKPSALTWEIPLVLQLQLGSDIQIYSTCFGLSPSPNRFAFEIYPTVFVKVFSLYAVDYKEKPLISQGFLNSLFYVYVVCIYSFSIFHAIYQVDNLLFHKYLVLSNDELIN